MTTLAEAHAGFNFYYEVMRKEILDDPRVDSVGVQEAWFRNHAYVVSMDAIEDPLLKLVVPTNVTSA